MNVCRLLYGWLKLFTNFVLVDAGDLKAQTSPAGERSGPPEPGGHSCARMLQQTHVCSSRSSSEQQSAADPTLCCPSSSSGMVRSHRLFISYFVFLSRRERLLSATNDVGERTNESVARVDKSFHKHVHKGQIGRNINNARR